MQCLHCGNQPPDGSRYCNMCGESFSPSPPRRAPSVPVEQRWIYVDLADLKLPSYLGAPAERSAVAAVLYERFTPFADDGWEWVVAPSDPAFDGWVYQNLDGRLAIVGAQLMCRRSRPWPAAQGEPGHHIAASRVRQLAERPWTAEPGSKRWRELRRPAS